MAVFAPVWAHALPDPAHRPASLEARASAFADAFVRDYVRALDIKGRAPLEAVSSRLAPRLSERLRADLAAQAADPDEVVGLDWDPFLSTQETPHSVAAGRARCLGDTCETPVFGRLGPRGKPELLSRLRLVRAGDGFLVSDVAGQDGVSLMAALRALRRERDRAVWKTHSGTKRSAASPAAP